MQEIFIPTLLTLQNANTFLGSFRGLRFCLTPLTDLKEVRAEYWHGRLCYDLSQMDGEKTFPLSEDGLAKLACWLTDLADHSEKLKENAAL